MQEATAIISSYLIYRNIFQKDGRLLRVIQYNFNKNFAKLT